MTRGSVTGVIPPLVTPLHPDRSFDAVSMRRLIERVLAAGVDGIFLLGSTGEAAFCDAATRAQVMTESVRAVAGRVPVLAGVIDMQTERVLEHVRAAESAGVDGIVATAPFYAVTAEPEVRRHFAHLAAQTALPIYAYDIPLCVGQKLSPELLVGLGEDGAIVGVKDSSGDDIAFRRLVLANREAGEPLTLLTGHEVMVDAVMLAGAHGSVPGLANVDPEGYVRLHAACLAGDWEAARGEQDRLAALMAITRVSRSARGWGMGVGAFKAALHLEGVIASGQLPLPFEALDPADVAAVAELLGRFGPPRTAGPATLDGLHG